VALKGDGLVGVHVLLAEGGGWDGCKGVELGAQPAQRLAQLRAGARVAEEGGLNYHEGPTAQRFGQLRQRRQPQQVADGGDLVGHGGGPCVPGVQHLGGALYREQQASGVQVADRVQPHLQRGHHAQAAAAPHGPKQVGLMVGVGADQLAVRGEARPR
jgi:hypothetical protein